VEWKVFRVSDVFEVLNLHPYHKNNLQVCFNGIPYITRTSMNNGLENCVELPDDIYLNNQNTITLGAENANFFYQPYKYITGNKMYSICHDKLNKYNGLFLINIFRQSIKNCGFGFGLGLTGSRFLTRLILLPIDSLGNLHWQFMEDYIKAEESRQKHLLLMYYKKKISGVG